MSNQTLSHVTLQSLENYRTAATQAVIAYRAGSHRLVRLVNGALQKSVYPRTAKLAPRATDRLDDVRGNVSDIVVKGIDLVADGAEKAIERGTNTASAQVGKVAKLAARIDNPLISNSLQTAARLSMPGAKVALVVSSRVADGATALASAAGARPVRKAVRKAVTPAKRKAVAPVARKAPPAAKPAARRVAKKAEVVKAPRVRAPRKTTPVSAKAAWA